MKILEQSVSIVSMTLDPLHVIERAGRVCYQSEPGGTEAFVARLIRNKHLSVLEHAGATVDFITDRGISHELVRHRIAAFSQESTRYCLYDDEIAVIKPPHFIEGTKIYEDWRQACEESERAYIRLVKQGIPAQWARSVLPTSLKTQLVMTCNFREWLHVLELRTHKSAHPQMQALMLELKNAFLSSSAKLIFS